MQYFNDGKRNNSAVKDPPNNYTCIYIIYIYIYQSNDSPYIAGASGAEWMGDVEASFFTCVHQILKQGKYHKMSGPFLWNVAIPIAWN